MVLLDSFVLARGLAGFIIIVYCSLILGLNFFVHKRMMKRIISSKNAKESVKVRKSYRRIRLLIILLYSAILIWILSNTMELLTTSDSTAGQFIFIGVIGMIILTYGSMSLPISGMTIDKFNPNNKYALYLRGFDSDSYEMSSTISTIVDHCHAPGSGSRHPNPEELSFSEEEFCRAIKKYLPIYSVGMTKELESPHGSKRIYLDDETWKEDVALLINKAKYVFINLHNSDSCIWEIMQCKKDASKKTYYFIDSLADYQNIIEQMQDGAPSVLQEISETIIEYGSQAKEKFMEPTNNEESERHVLNEITKREFTELREKIYDFIEEIKKSQEIKLSENFDQELEDAFIDKKAKLHLVVFNDGKNNRVMHYKNTEKGVKILLRKMLV